MDMHYISTPAKPGALKRDCVFHIALHSPYFPNSINYSVSSDQSISVSSNQYATKAPLNFKGVDLGIFWRGEGGGGEGVQAVQLQLPSPFKQDQ